MWQAPVCSFRSPKPKPYAVLEIPKLSEVARVSSSAAPHLQDVQPFQLLPLLRLPLRLQQLTRAEVALHCFISILSILVAVGMRHDCSTSKVRNP